MRTLDKRIERAKEVIKGGSRANKLELLQAIHVAEDELGTDCTIDEIIAWANGDLKGKSDDDTND